MIQSINFFEFIIYLFFHSFLQLIVLIFFSHSFVIVAFGNQQVPPPIPPPPPQMNPVDLVREVFKTVHTIAPPPLPAQPLPQEHDPVIINQISEIRSIVDKLVHSVDVSVQAAQAPAQSPPQIIVNIPPQVRMTCAFEDFGIFRHFDLCFWVGLQWSIAMWFCCFVQLYQFSLC
jgi:hypothetical protein